MNNVDLKHWCKVDKSDKEWTKHFSITILVISSGHMGIEYDTECTKKSFSTECKKKKKNVWYVCFDLVQTDSAVYSFGLWVWKVA